ncbi:hypothetical protein [Thermus thermophilus]|uniref:Uncharacterized protein n=1 Tax=Thermus thermophilus TaxID=274 RepID=A0A7R7TDQ2_THETH|nr:hypothetical protein [Thermus thermophilus]BCP66015.1 hypothetical protein TthHB5018_09490 [Thermus thermophilus]
MNLSDLRAHWDYFLALDEDLRTLRRYIAFHEDNLETFSLELHRVIQMAALEVEAVLLSLCRGIFGGCGGKRSPSFADLDLLGKNFVRQKWGIGVEDIEVHFLGLGVPWIHRVSRSTPGGTLKHGRTQALKKATLRHALMAVGALATWLTLGSLGLPEPREPDGNLHPVPEVVRRVVYRGYSLGEPAHVFGPPYEVWYVESPNAHTLSRPDPGQSGAGPGATP